LEAKKIGVIILVLLAFGAAFYFFVDLSNEEKLEDDEKEIIEETMKDKFQKNLLSSNEVYIVMDTRNAPNSTISDGILQCGVDLAGSQGLFEKNITILGLNAEECFGIKNESVSIDECLLLIDGKMQIYITSENRTEYFEKRLVVSINEQYAYKACDINFKEN